MITEGHSGTKHWCKDCGKSLHSCKWGYREVPCHVLRKLATKSEVFYNQLWKDENLMPDDILTHVKDKCYSIKYMKDQKYSYEIICLAISYVIYEDYTGQDQDVDFLFEYEDSTIGVGTLADKIRWANRKIMGFE